MNPLHRLGGVRRVGWLSLAVGLVALAAAGAQADFMPRTALYAVVRACALAQDTLGRPFPCLAVAPAEPAPRTVVLRAPGHATHVILVPTAPIPGIEDPRLRRAPYGALWPAALAARRFVHDGAGFPVRASAVVLAVNADATRSQDQLHIHAECLRPALLSAIRDMRGDLGPGWRPLPRPFLGDPFVARLMRPGDLASENLFASLSAAPGLPGDLSGVTVLVVPAEVGDPTGGEAGLIVLASAARRRTVETLFDPNCRAARRSAG